MTGPFAFAGRGVAGLIGANGFTGVADFGAGSAGFTAGAGVAATVIAMHHGEIPPTINLDNPDPECDLDYVPQPGRKVEIEHAVCNCIAFGSKNSALVLRRIA